MGVGLLYDRGVCARVRRLTIKENEREFAAPAFHGHRFDANAMPVEVLKELEVYERLIVDVAKALFLQRNSDRKRVPKGFEQRLRLSIRAVDPGSAIPVLLRTAEVRPRVDM